MSKFRKFIEINDIPSGMAQSPENPDSTMGDTDTHNDSRVLNKELGISDKDAKIADQFRTFLCHATLEFPEDGVKVLGPTDVRIEPVDGQDNMYKLTVYATNPRKVQDLHGNDYQGDKIEFSKEIDKKTFEAIKAQGWNSGGPQIPGMGGGMGGGLGGDMGGGLGGAPPMGGGLGGPPMLAHTEYPTFKDWISLKETGTTTADVAAFARPCLPMIRRFFSNLNGKKKKPYKVPQVED